jgi:hypothetical protein
MSKNKKDIELKYWSLKEVGIDGMILVIFVIFCTCKLMFKFDNSLFCMLYLACTGLTFKKILLTKKDLLQKIELLIKENNVKVKNNESK